jgi:hypothetical protein
MRRQRQLDEDPRDIGVGSQLVDHSGGGFLGDVTGQVSVHIVRPGLNATFSLVAHTDCRGRILTEQDGGQHRRGGQSGVVGGDPIVHRSAIALPSMIVAHITLPPEFTQISTA